ncbi:MAG TPA: hypothetical protein VGO07_07390 [Candidatus Saccharimonadales bacterium]|nr:hypothetical protein [Candidatus Saccharimonadales bacterium]
MNPKEKKELAISEIVLITLGVIGLAVVLWLAWFRPTDKKMVSSYQTCTAAGNAILDSYPSVCVTKGGQRFVNPKEKVTLPAAPSADQQAQTTPDQKYLTVNEWGVRVPLTVETIDLKYTYTKNDNEYARFTFQRLEDIGICKDDVGVAMSRTATENQAPFSIDNPEPIAHIGAYYYYAAYGGSPCYDSNNADQMKVVNAISPDTNLTTTVKQLLQKLQSAT